MSLREVVYCYDPQKNRDVKAGYIEDGVFFKHVMRRKHFLRVVSGYAIQTDVINILHNRGVKNIKIIEKDTRAEFNIPMADFMRLSRPWSHGHGQQLCISEKFFNQPKPKEELKNEVASDKPTGKLSEVQLPLW